MLDGISDLADLRALDEKSLPALADELRAETIAAVSRTGGHLGAGLGVVELTVALHYIFETPRDILIWDVGHQCYPHKILTGRRSRIHTLRQKDGLSGFTQRDESEFDPFGAAHASTSISAGLGFAVARDLRATETAPRSETETTTGTTTKGAGEKGVNKDDDGQQRVICVIGDGAMSAGMAYEAMNNAGALGSRLIVILNDNDMSIAPPVGAMSAYLSRLLSSRSYQSTRIVSRSLASRFPRPVERTARRAEEYARGMLTGGTLFEEMGFFYVGPVDGHNLSHLLPLLRNLRTAHDRYGDAGEPFLLHVVTEKGRGYAPAEAAPDKLHGVSAGFDKVPSPKNSAPANSAPAKKETKQSATANESATAKAPTKQSAPAKQTTTKQTTTQSAPAKAAATKKQLPSWTRTFSAALVEAGERD
ncbi:MAG: hypothetical protein MPK03_02405, partial [Alphaproteobacteria bacterium]|nr:hypothetical protein [Alphaproteobacteria bacterium]